MVMKEKDEELLLFLEMRRREKEKNDSLLLESPDAPFGTCIYSGLVFGGPKPDVSPISKIVSSMPVPQTGPDEFLDSENDRTDYDCYIMEGRHQGFCMQVTASHTTWYPTFPSLEMESQKTVMNQIEVSNARPATLKSRLPNLQPQPASRSNDAARQPAMSSGLNSSHTGNRRPLSSEAQINGNLQITSRSATPSVDHQPQPRRVQLGASAPPARSSSVAKSGPTAAAPPGRSSSVVKSGPTASKSTVPSRGSSPIVKSRPQKPLRNLGRGSLGSSSSNGNSIPAMRRAHSNGSDNVSPVLIGTKMVERVVNMRKLAPPKQDDHRSAHPAGKSSSAPDSSGFGRTLSKKSLDMALRHMDIRRSIQGNLRPLMTNIPASSMYSVRSGPTKEQHSYEIEDDELGSDRGHSSPASRQGSWQGIEETNCTYKGAEGTKASNVS
ncbi:hypothetical protein CK203_018772 [Vitis vinifera]|uniref:Uncharacterized protein n=1 Tax=Vitis vinifera TaxID=29760 RepID=A0A438JAH7_VITVI|nr:hypothetical protein CK203_018772 [Vitis vinifera]